MWLTESVSISNMRSLNTSELFVSPYTSELLISLRILCCLNLSQHFLVLLALICENVLEANFLWHTCTAEGSGTLCVEVCCGCFYILPVLTIWLYNLFSIL